MKRIALFAICALAVSTSAFAQRGRGPAPAAALEPGASQADVDKALMAAPEGLKNGAEVIKWNADHQTYTMLRKGSNNIVCYDRSGFPQQQAVSSECTAVGNLDRVKQNLKFEALGDRAKTQAAVKEAEMNGTRVKPVFGSVFYHAMGPDAEHLRHHMTIYVPGATAQSLGMPDNPREGTAWIMDGGTTGAHIMTPGE